MNKSLLQSNENLSLKSALFSAIGLAYFFVCLTTATLRCQFSCHRRSFLRSLFLWCLCLKWGRPHIEAFEVAPCCEFCTTLLCSRACMHIIFHSAHFKPCAQWFGVCTMGGSHFLCLIWNGWIAYPVLISSPSRTLILPVECTLGGCTRSVVQRWLQKSHFHPVVSCLPWENRIRSKWEMFSVAQQWHTAVWLYTPINIHFHAN